MPEINYAAWVAASDYQDLAIYQKNLKINRGGIVVYDNGMHAEELAYIKGLGLEPMIDIEVVIWNGGHITDPISDYHDYLVDLKNTGWTIVFTEGGRAGDPEYIQSLGLKYGNFNCDQCGLWLHDQLKYLKKGDIVPSILKKDKKLTVGNQYLYSSENQWECYYTSEVQYIENGANATKAIPSGLLAGMWANNNNDNPMLTNSINGTVPNYKSLLDWSYSSASVRGFTTFATWYGSWAQLVSLGLDKVVLNLQKSYAPAGNNPVPPNPTPIDDSDPYAVAITSDGTRHYFKRGVNNDLQHRTATTDWSSLGGVLTSAPAAVGIDNDVYIAVRGADPDPAMIDSLYVRSLVKQGWLNIGGLGTSSPGIAASPVEPRITIVVRGNDKACWSKTLNVTLNVWGQWTSMGGATN